jgi:hypothetical protein
MSRVYQGCIELIFETFWEYNEYVFPSLDLKSKNDIALKHGTCCSGMPGFVCLFFFVVVVVAKYGT